MIKNGILSLCELSSELVLENRINVVHIIKKDLVSWRVKAPFLVVYVHALINC